MLPPTYLLVASDRHMHAPFVASGSTSYRARYAGAGCVNSLQIAAHFVGRAVGLAEFFSFSKQTSKPVLKSVKQLRQTHEQPKPRWTSSVLSLKYGRDESDSV